VRMNMNRVITVEHFLNFFLKLLSIGIGDDERLSRRS
jgi:hypothetical protein